MKASAASAVLILLAASCGSEELKEPEASPVEAVVLEPQMISRTVYGPCRLQAGEEAVISVPVPAVVEEVNVAPGDTVHAGQRLLSLRTDDMRRAEIHSAAAAVSAARASEEYASSNLSRAEELFQENALSPSAFQEAQTAARAAEAAYMQAQAGYAAAVSSAGSGDVTAPFAGTVGRVIATQGNPASGPLLSIFSSKVLETELLLAPVHLHSLRQGLPAVFQTDHFPGEIFRGTVVSVAGAADPISGLVPVVVQYTDTTGALVPGMSGMTMLMLETREEALVLPESALTPVGECCWKAVVIRDGRAVTLDVSTGISNGIRHEVTQGLSAGDTVITLGNTLVQDGEEVRAVNL